MHPKEIGCDSGSFQSCYSILTHTCLAHAQRQCFHIGPQPRHLPAQRPQAGQRSAGWLHSEAPPTQRMSGQGELQPHCAHKIRVSQSLRQVSAI